MCVYIYTYTHALHVQGSRKMLGVCGTWCGTELYVYIYIYQYIHIHRYICIYTYTHTHFIDTGIKESGWCVRHLMRHRSRYINTYIYIYKTYTYTLHIQGSRKVACERSTWCGTEQDSPKTRNGLVLPGIRRWRGESALRACAQGAAPRAVSFPLRNISKRPICARGIYLYALNVRALKAQGRAWYSVVEFQLGSSKKRHAYVLKETYLCQSNLSVCMPCICVHSKWSATQVQRHAW